MRLIFNKLKSYCLKCRSISCYKGEHESYRFLFSHKLRVPPTDNKTTFRKFLDDCPEFVNLVEESQQDLFLELLRDVKYFNKTINGQQWTNISK